MKIKDLKNTKIYLSNKEDRIKFQKKVFKLGVNWSAGEPQNIMDNVPFFYIDNNLKLTFDSLHQKNFFLEYEDKQIFLEDVMSIEEPEKEYIFNVFDKVLVRNFDDDIWIPKLFFRRLGNTNTYVTIDDRNYKQCIPYEGNEEFMSTSKSIIN